MDETRLFGGFFTGDADTITADDDGCGEDLVQVVGGPADPQHVMLPGTPLIELRSNHKAFGWLRAQGYNARDIAAIWGLRHALCNPVARPFFSDERIVVPICSVELGPMGRYVPRSSGWEAISMVERDDAAGWPPHVLCSKGLDGASLLYGLHIAMAGRGPVAVVRAVTDAWRLTSNVVAFRLSSISPYQTYLIARRLRHRPIVVLLDRRSRWTSAKVAREIRDFRRRECDPTPVLEAELPDHRVTVAECTAEEAWEAMSAALDKTRPCTG